MDGRKVTPGDSRAFNHPKHGQRHEAHVHLPRPTGHQPSRSPWSGQYDSKTDIETSLLKPRPTLCPYAPLARTQGSESPPWPSIPGTTSAPGPRGRQTQSGGPGHFSGRVLGIPSPAERPLGSRDLNMCTLPWLPPLTGVTSLPPDLQ